MITIPLSEAFQHIRHHLPRLGDLPWQSGFNLDDGNTVATVAEALVQAQHFATEVGLSSLSNLTKEIIRDIDNLHLRATNSMDERTLQFLRFIICVIPMQVTLILGNKGDCYDWCLTSIMRDYDASQQKNTGRAFIPIYQPGDPSIAGMCLAEMPGWIFVFFTLARTFGGLNGLADQFIRTCWLLMSKSFEISANLPALQAMSAISTYAIATENPNARDTALYLEALWNSKDIPRGCRSILGITLTTELSRYTLHDSTEWAEIVLSEYGDCLREHERLQLLCSATKTEDKWKARGEEILSEVRRVSRSTRDSSSKMGGVPALALEERVGVITPLVHFLASAGLLSDLVEVLAAWYERAEDGAPPNPNVLYVCPTYHLGTLVLWPGGRALLPLSDEKDELDSLLTTVSAALGELYHVSGANQSSFDESYRQGLPIYDWGSDLESKILAHYDPGHIAATVPHNFKPGSLIVFPSVPGPVQAVYSRVGLGAPLQTSFHLPEPDRIGRTISVWAGESYFTAFEVAVLEHVAAKNGWRIRCSGPTGKRDLDRAAFKSFYEDPEPDIIWIVGHGRFVPHRPAESGVDLDSDNVVSIADISRFVAPRMNRRLVVLNICNGATAQVTGGAARFGFAQEIVGRSQAVVGHLWPVDPLVALTFGALLACALNGRNFYPAFDTAMTLFRQPAASITYLEQALGPEHEALSRIRSRREGMDNILHWGCPVFLT